MKSRSSRRAAAGTSPARHLEEELFSLRAKLRRTIRSYRARLEGQLEQSILALRASVPPEEMPRERLHQLRDLTVMVRKRKVKLEKGRRKDARVHIGTPVRIIEGGLANVLPPEEETLLSRPY